MRVQKIQNTTPQFKGLYIKNVDIDHIKKCIDPIRGSLEFLSQKCDIHIKGTIIPKYIKKDAIVGKPGLRIVVKNLPEDSFAYALKNLFMRRTKSVKTTMPIHEIASVQGKYKLLNFLSSSVEFLNEINPKRFFDS